MDELIRELLKEMGEDPSREGLEKTPGRVAKAWEYLTSGYRQDVREVLNGALFTEEYDEMVVVKDIDFYSMCEHHLLPFFGKCHIAYMPSKKIVGLSKMPRLVEVFARRLQNQETLTRQIAGAVEAGLKPKGVAVLIDAEHQCMTTRGVHHRHVSTITTNFTGVFKTDLAMQERFLNFCSRK